MLTSETNQILQSFRVDVENEGPGATVIIAQEWLYHMRTDDAFMMYPRSAPEIRDHSTHYRLAWLGEGSHIDHARRVLSRLAEL